MIETELKNLATAIKELTDVLRDRRTEQPITSPVAQVPVFPTQTAPAPAAPVFTPEVVPPAAPAGMQFAEAQSRLAAVAQRLGKPDQVIALMQSVGGPPLTKIDPSQYGSLVSQAEALQ